MSLLLGYAMGQLLSVGREAKVEFVEKMHQPLEKPWRKRKGSNRRPQVWRSRG